MSGNISRPKISAVVIAFNEERNIRECLETLRWADEVVVVDNASTDGTARISREFTSHVYWHEFTGFGRLRNESAAHATHDWVFSLDADERATPEVQNEMYQRLQESPDVLAYCIPRRNHFLGKWIKYSGWYPNYRHPQLFHKKSMRYTEDIIHEGYEVNGPVGYLRAPIDHYPFRDIQHFFEKMNRYTTLMAKKMNKQERPFKAHQLLTHPSFTFFKMFCLRLGFLDGTPGLILAGLYAYYTFVKYAKLWELGHVEQNR